MQSLGAWLRLEALSFGYGLARGETGRLGPVRMRSLSLAGLI